MPDSTVKLVIALCLIVPLVIIVNLALLGMLRDRHPRSHAAKMPKVGNLFGNPWQREDDQLNELSKRIAELNPKPSEPPDDHPSDSGSPS